MPLSGFDPLVAEWFARRFSAPTEPQRLGWPEIRGAVRSGSRAGEVSERT